MTITAEQLAKIAGGKLSTKKAANIQSMATSLEAHGRKVGLDQFQRLAQFLAQVCTESGGFQYDRELWGPTKAQERYEGRNDLGNTKPGDGKKFAGHGPMQVTGRGNTTRFYVWCCSLRVDPPDFVDNPELINTDPWEGLSAIWYWTQGNPTGKSLNSYADENNILQITKYVNGGLNGFDERVRYYVRAGLVLLGWEPSNVTGFQRWAQEHGYLPQDTADRKQVDGDPGPLTMSAIHLALAAASKVGEVPAAPVTEVQTQHVEVPTPVVVAGSDKSGSTWLMGVIGMLAPAFGAFTELDTTTKLVLIALGIGAVAFLIWRGEVIARRIKSVVKEFGS